MENLFNYGEFLICFGPVFLVIAIIFGALLWKSLPDHTKKKDVPKEEDQGHDER